MTLSITQRLIITVALSSAIVLFFSGWAFHLALTRGLEATAIEQGHSKALEVDHSIWIQLDEDLLVDFAGERVEFDKLNIPFTDWAVVRGNGFVEAAHGILQGHKPPDVGKPAEIISLDNDQMYVMASIELIRKKLMTWTNLPSETQQTILTEVPDGTFLWAKSDVVENHNVFAVQMLSATHITDLSVTEEGQLIETQIDELAKSLPAGILIVDHEDQTLQNPSLVGWEALDSELLAIIQGQDPESGELVRVVVNRLGEHYHVTQDGSVGQKQDGSRLWVVAVSNISFDMAKKRTLSQNIHLIMGFIWVLIVLIAWLVTKRALKPVHEIVQQAEKIVPSNMNERLPFRDANDELSYLAKTVNKMLDRIQAGYDREQQFTGDASHEMRNPLAKMIAEIDLALSKNRDPKAYKEILIRLKGYSEGMQHLTNSLLILARLDGGLQTLDIQPFDASELVVAALTTLPKASASRVHLTLGPSTHPMMAIAHESLMGILTRNLLDNALRYSPADSPVFVRIHRRGKTVYFAIEDQGVGIPEDQRKLIFNRFYRIDKSRAQSTGGAGLGLTIVHAIADMHHITVDLKPGNTQGTVVSFSLPIQHD